MRTTLLPLLSLLLLAPAARAESFHYGGLSITTWLIPGIDIFDDRPHQVLLTLGISEGHAIFTPPGPVQAWLFTDTWWTSADVGKTVWVSNGPAFDIVRRQMTDGQDDTIGFGQGYYNRDGQPVVTQNFSQYSPDRFLTHPSESDLHNYEIHRIGLRVDSMQYRDVIDYYGKRFVDFTLHSRYIVEASPIPEPAALTTTAATAALLGLLRRPRRR